MKCCPAGLAATERDVRSTRRTPMWASRLRTNSLTLAGDNPIFRDAPLKLFSSSTATRAVVSVMLGITIQAPYRSDIRDDAFGPFDLKEALSSVHITDQRCRPTRRKEKSWASLRVRLQSSRVDRAAWHWRA